MATMHPDHGFPIQTIAVGDVEEDCIDDCDVDIASVVAAAATFVVDDAKKSIILLCTRIQRRKGTNKKKSLCIYKCHIVFMIAFILILPNAYVVVPVC